MRPGWWTGIVALLAVATPATALAQADFTAVASPNPVTLRAGGASQDVTVTTTAGPAFQDPITYSFTGFPSGLSTGGSQTTFQPYPPLTFTFSADAGVGRGTYTGTLVGSSPSGSNTFPMTVVVQVPDFSISVSPSAGSADPGGSFSVVVSVMSIDGFSDMVTVEAPTLAGITFSPTVFDVAPGGSQSVTVLVSPGAAPGIRSGNFRGTAATVAGERTASLTVDVTSPPPPPDFSITVIPSTVDLEPGQSVSLEVAVTPIAGFNGTVSVEAPSLPGVTFSPAAFDIPAGGSSSVTLHVDPGAPQGPRTGSFRGQAPGVTGERTAPLTLRVTSSPPPPVPDFSVLVTPGLVKASPGEAPSVVVTVLPAGGFTGTASIEAPSLPDIVFAPSIFDISAGDSRAVRVIVDPRAVPASHTGSFRATAPGVAGARSASIEVQIASPASPPPSPDYSVTVSPSSLELPVGASASIIVAVAGSGGFDDTVTLTAPSLPGLAFVPGVFDLRPGGSRSVAVTADTDAAPGTMTGHFRATSRTLSGERTATFTVRIPDPAPSTPPPTPDPDFSIAVDPIRLALAPGESGIVNLSATGIRGFGGMIDVSVLPVMGVTADPAALSIPAGGSRAVVLNVAPTATAGTETVVFSGTAGGVTGARTAAVTVAIEPTPPVITAITPAAVVTGTTDNRLRLTGENFQPGATITSPSPGVEVTSVRIVSTRAADVMVRVLPGADPGPYELLLRNPDGGIATGGSMLLVYPAGALGAPLAVTAALIVHPRPFQILEDDDPVYARGLLATSGMGTVVGTWLLDGVPFDRFTRMVSGGFPAEIRSNVPIPRSFTGEHRLELVVESPATLPPEEVPFFQAVESRSRLRLLAPDPGEVVDLEAPSFRWTLVPGASGYEIEVQELEESASPDRPRIVVRRRVAATEWRPERDLLRRLGPGPMRVRVRAVYPGEVEGTPTAWRAFEIGPLSDASRGPESLFRLASWSSAANAEGGDPQAQAPPGAELALSLFNTTSAMDSDVTDQRAITRLQLSTQTDARGAVLDQQATADLSGSHDLEEPWHSREESRNWMMQVGATEGRFRQQATVGFAPPSFFDQSEFLAAGFSNGAVQARLGTPLGHGSYYRSVDLSANGSYAAFEPDIQAAAYEAFDAAGRYLFRTTWLEVTDPVVDGFSAGGEGRALGAIGVVDLGPYARLLGEFAGGEFEPGEGSFEEKRDGRAFRVGLQGAAGTFGYALAVGRTGEGFVNPANRGFTPGGVSDRTRAEVSLQKAFGRASLSGTYRHVRGGIPEAAADPETTENGAALQLAFTVGQRVSASFGGSFVGQDGDAVEDLGLPRTDRMQRALDFRITETLGPFSLSQAVTWQNYSDDVQPLSDQTVTGLSASASGALASFLNLAVNISNTRTKAAPEIGTRNQFLVSLQPAVTMSSMWLALTPRAAWSRASNDLDDSEFKTDQYQIVLRWTPPWAGALLNLEVASDWNRGWSDLEPDPPSFDRQTVLTLTLNWRADRAWGVSQGTGASARREGRTPESARS